MLNILLKEIRSGARVITVNTRLARYLRLRYDEEMRRSGQTMWPSPEIIPLSAWLRKELEEACPGIPLLSEVRSRVLWESVVHSDDLIAGGRILLPDGAARAAFKAYALLKEYRLSFPEDEIYLTEEARALKRWAGLYERKVAGLGFAGQNSVSGRVVEGIDKGEIHVSGRITFAGFDDLTPVTDEIIEAIRKKGAEVSFWPQLPDNAASEDGPGQNGCSVIIKRHDDELEEVKEAARWVRESYVPGKRIGIIVTSLDRYRSAIMREFEAELMPASVLPGERGELPFNISLGCPLSDEPVVRSAMDILSIGQGDSGADKISSILLSPYFAADDDERLESARLDLKLRERGRPEISLYGLRNTAARGGDALTRLSERIDRWIRALEGADGRRLPGQWALHFTSLLKATGWPSPGITLSSGEYQALQALTGLLASLVSLDDITGKIEKREALRLLGGMARDSIHQPESSESPIQVLGLLESSGMHFDHIRVLGAHEDAFPASPSPNPFIPVFMQLAAGLPHSSSERELSFARGIVRRLLSSTGEMTVTYPAIVDDKELALSPLFKMWGGEAENKAEKQGRGLKEALHIAGGVEAAPPQGKIAVDELELGTVRGGSSILKDQSACPFRAFAIHRLGARGMAVAEPGLDARQRGTILHIVLEDFWAKVRDWKNLKAITDGGRITSVIEGCISKALEQAELFKPFSARFLEMERERLESLMTEWLGLELERLPFSVAESEKRKEIDIKGLRLRCDIDRIDMTDAGGSLLIDYKTGRADSSDWESDRPKEPQMMLYSLSGDYDSVAFARVRRGECSFSGIAKEKLAPGIKVIKEGEWIELMESWKETVYALADGFVEGCADVDPRDYGTDDSACSFCDLTMLCRISEDNVS